MSILAGGLINRHYIRSCWNETRTMVATFLDLPAELRNAIYELYLIDHRQNQIVVVDGKGHAHDLLPPLCRTSRRIRMEFCSLWQTLDSDNAGLLKVHVDDLNFAPLRSWLDGEILNPKRHRFHEVQVIFRFTDISTIAAQKADTIGKWHNMPFHWVSGRYKVEDGWHYGRHVPRAYTTWVEPRVRHIVELDRAGLGGEGAQRR